MNRAFLSILLLLIAEGVWGQNYFDNNPRWTYQRSCTYEPPCRQQLQYHHYVSGDTLIDGKNYKKVATELKTEWYWMSSLPRDPECTGYMFSHEPVHYLRQEGKKLYAYHGEQDTLLYDFATTVGSKVPLSLYNSDDNIDVVGEGAVSINGQDRRLLYVQGESYASTLIEGIGHSRGLFQEIYNLVDCSTHLNCYSVGDTRYYKEGSYEVSDGSCMSSAGLASLQLDYTYSIFFDQGSQTLKVKISEDVQPGKLVIINLLGQKVYVNDVLLPRETEQVIPLQAGVSGVLVLRFEIKHVGKSSKLFIKG